MLPRRYRFSFKRGYPKKIINEELFTLRHQENNTHLHLSVIVSKKIDTRASSRNKLKRLFIKILKENISRDMKKDFVFILKPKILGQDSDTITKHVKEIYSRVK